MLFDCARLHSITGKFVHVESFYGRRSAGCAVGTGKLNGLLLVQFIDLEIPLNRRIPRSYLLYKPAAWSIDVW